MKPERKNTYLILHQQLSHMINMVWRLEYDDEAKALIKALDIARTLCEFT